MPTAENYRHTDEKRALKYLFSDRCKYVDWSGIENLNSSGSGYLKKKHLDKILAQKKEPTFIFNISFYDNDTYYLNDKNLKWYYGIVLENNQITGLNKNIIKRAKYKIRQKISNFDITDLDRLIDEKIMLSEYEHVTYFQINPPAWLSEFEYMNDVIQAFESIPVGSHVYFHCNRGRGRTTTFMTLYDIFRNYKTQPLQDIIDRHYCLGGEDIGNTEPKKNGTWKPTALTARYDLVARFYKYMNDPIGYPNHSWIEWLSHQNIKTDATLLDYKKAGTER